MLDTWNVRLVGEETLEMEIEPPEAAAAFFPLVKKRRLPFIWSAAFLRTGAGGGCGGDMIDCCELSCYVGDMITKFAAINFDFVANYFELEWSRVLSAAWLLKFCD